MKRSFIAGLIIVIMGLTGCITLPKTKPECIEGPCYETLTSIMTVEYDPDWDNRRTYHFRYPGTLGMTFDPASKMYQIEGVATTQPYPYSVVVYKGNLYSWEEIEPQIIEISNLFEIFIKSSGEIEIEEIPEDKEGI